MYAWALIFLLGAIVVAAAYTRTVVRCEERQVWEWLHNAAASFLSLLLALSSGFFAYECQRRHEAADERRQMRKLAGNELKRISQLMSGERVAVQCGDIKANVLIQYVQPLGLERAAVAGSTDSDTAADLAQIANEVRTYNNYTIRLFDALDQGCAGANAARLDAAIRSLAQTEEVMRKNIETELPKLESP